MVMTILGQRAVFSFLTTVGLFSAPAHAEGRMCRELFHPTAPHLSQAALAQNTEAREEWLLNEKRRLDRELAKSPHLKKFERQFRVLYGKESTLQQENIDGLGALKLIKLGLDQTTELVLSSERGSRVLLSSRDLRRDGPARILRFELSPAKDAAAVVFIEKGSIDGVEAIVYDLKNGKTALERFSLANETVAWLNETTIIYNGRTSSGSVKAFKWDIQKPKPIESQWNTLLATESGVLIGNVGSTYSDYSEVAKLSDGTYVDLQRRIPQPDFDSLYGPIVGVSGRYLYLRTKTLSHREVYRVRIDDDTSKGEQILSAPRNASFASIGLASDYLFVDSYSGASRSLMIYDLTGNPISNVIPPEGTRIIRANWVEPGSRLSVVLSSAVNSGQAFIYDVKRKRFEEDDISTRLMTLDDQEYVSSVVEVTSADGRIIPVRLTHRKGLKRDGANPSLIEAYGGFGLSFYAHPYYDPSKINFLKSGGILVGPALRGGDEFGYDWHVAAMAGSKVKTMDDLIATARYLTQNSYSAAKNIAAMGASHGGLVVAAAGLRAPDAFGLIIPINGVHDMMDYVRLGGSNFSEYGDPENPHVYEVMKSYSPVKLASEAQRAPDFLIIAGRSDTRVNPAHSYRLTSALLENPNLSANKIHLYSLKNAGHWVDSPSHQGSIGWRTQSYIWTRIFDHFGRNR